MTSAPEARKFVGHRVVFFGSVGLILAFVLAAAIASQTLGDGFGALQHAIANYFGWVYVLAMALFLALAVFLACSPFGRIRLGPDDARPEFNRATWFAMLFSAGMGIGLLFWSVAEPIQHFKTPPTGEGGDAAAAHHAMQITFFHWGLHPWGLYAVVGLGLAYFAYRHHLPLAIRSVFHPLLGERIHGWIGDAVDILAVVSTMFGVATSLGLGAMQIASGMEHLSWVSQTNTVYLAIIAAITAVATVSVVSGVHRGMRRLSEINLILAGTLLLFVLLAGSTGLLLRELGRNLVGYVAHLPEATFRTGWFSSAEERQWMGGTTVFYWAWWIAWSPFVGMFIARISRGRTVREFILGVLLVPTLLTFLWLTVFGNSALSEELHGEGGIVAAVDENVSTALYVLLDRYPLATFTSVVAMISVTLFFVTSSDSASLVIDIITAGGAMNPPVWQRVFWAVSEGVVAAVLLVSGGLSALQTASITAALPFCAVLLVLCVSLVIAMRRDLREEQLS